MFPNPIIPKEEVNSNPNSPDFSRDSDFDSESEPDLDSDYFPNPNDVSDSDLSEQWNQYFIASLAIQPNPEDPYMQVYNENLVIPPQAPTTPPPDFYTPDEPFPPNKKTCFPSPTPPYVFETGESSHKSPLERHQEWIEMILNHLDEIPLERIEEIENDIYGLKNGRVLIQKDFRRLEIELEKANTQIMELQKKQELHADEVVLARVRISTLEMIIEDIQLRHHSDTKILLEAIQDLKNHK